jgi:hypothetical protein
MLLSIILHSEFHLRNMLCKPFIGDGVFNYRLNLLIFTPQRREQGGWKLET